MKRSRHRAAAFLLVEVTLAIGIMAFAVLAVVGLLPLGLQSVKTGTDEMAAIGILGALETDLEVSPVTSAASAQFHIDRLKTGIQGTAGSQIYLNAEGAVSSLNDARYRLVVENLAPIPATLSPDFVYRCRAKISWPAGARVREDGSPETATGSVEIYLAFRPV